MNEVVADSVKNVEGFHNEIGEIKSFLTEIPELIEPKKQFLQIERAENFSREKLIKHFQIEEQNIFPYIITRFQDTNLNALVYDLREEHNIILQQIEKFQSMVYGNVFPLSKEVLEEINLTLKNISYALMLHVIKEDEKIFSLVKDNKKIVEILNKNVKNIEISKDLQEVVDVLHHLAEAEILIAKFYNLCATQWEEEKGFWLKVAQQEVHHFQNIKKMIVCILRRPDKFISSKIFKLAATKTFISGIENNIKEIEQGKMSKIKMISLANDLEQTIMENKYDTIVKTEDLEYNILAREIVEETAIHREIISTKFKYYSSNLPKG